MSVGRDTDDSWDRYWDHGFLTSCSSAFDANYEGAIRALWTEFLSRVPAGGRVLDICTGNGAVALIASEVSRSRALDLEIHGVDSAAIRPLETVRDQHDLLRDIHFHPQTAVEDMPFPDGHFDAITGQYAFEYTDEDRCIVELARVAAPGGRILLVIHHTESVVMQTTREEIRNASLIFDETAIFDRAREIIEIVGRARSAAERRALAHDPRAEQARLALNAAAKRISSAIDASPHPELLQTAINRVAQAYRMLDEIGQDQALEALENSRAELTANLGRLRDLTAAARDAEQIRHICARMSTNGLTPAEPGTIRHDGSRLMGWRVEARKTV